MIKVDDETIIRTIEEKDLETMHNWNTADFCGNYQPFEFESKQSLLKKYNENGFCSNELQILLIEINSKPSGLVYIKFIREGIADIGIVLSGDIRKKGLGTIITSATVNFLFSNYNICRIQADTDINNIPAQKVLERAGFEKEGILKKYRYHHGNYSDSVLYSIIR
ncbi:MAG: N-acetyltransferase [Clostridiales bacterium]|nr:MAG: N-acetyltransferase [Clostridiales bacterium]